MGKLRSRTIAVILLVVWSTVVCAGNWSPKYRDLVADKGDQGEIIFFLIYVIICEYGKTLDRSYACPVYCAVDHKHNIGKYETKIKQEPDEKTDPGIPRSVVASNR